MSSTNESHKKRFSLSIKSLLKRKSKKVPQEMSTAIQDTLKQMEDEHGDEFANVDFDEFVSKLQQIDNGFVKNVSKHNHNTKHIDTIMSDDSEIPANKAVKWLIGDRLLWSSESGEVKVFRKTMETTKTISKEEAEETSEPSLPKVHLTNEPLPQNASDSFICKVNIHKTGGVVKTVKCNFDQTANEFASFIINKINKDHSMDMLPEKWVLKASGALDYLYGDIPMKQFAFVRECLKKGDRVPLTLFDKESAIAEGKSHNGVQITYDIANRSRDLTNCVPVTSLTEPFQFYLSDIKGLTLPEDVSPGSEIYVVAQLYHGTTSISFAQQSSVIVHDPDCCRWQQTIGFPDFTFAALPRETTLRLVCFARPHRSRKSKNRQSLARSMTNMEILSLMEQAEAANHDKSKRLSIRGGDFFEKLSILEKDIPIAGISFPVFSFSGILKSDEERHNMWTDVSRLFYCSENWESRSLPVVTVSWLSREQPTAYMEDSEIPENLVKNFSDYDRERSVILNKPQQEIVDQLNKIIGYDPLQQLTDDEKMLLWAARVGHKNLLMSNYRALPKFMLAVPWQYPTAVRQVHEMLEHWKSPDEPLDALELLSYNYTDEHVRMFAVNCLSQMEDSEFADILLQLVQAVKFELYHDSPLARLLIQRALSSTNLIGHVLYWHMKAEMHDPAIKERFGVILEEYLLHCGSHARDLLKQQAIVDQLLDIALKIKSTKKSDIPTVLKEELGKLKLPDSKFKLPLSTKIEVKKLIVEKCKVMNSKKLPIWLVFQNADSTGENVNVIFKAGDDLRQDLLTLQILKNMDVIWKKRGIDLRLTPYGCVCLGDMLGMIEVVVNSDTIANITHERGGASAAFSNDPLTVWLQKHNTIQQNWEKCVQNFTRSSAGYCCATYVLGIGDRHNDNIMLTKRGDLFHIDFGHFLGHFKTYKGIYKRETTPFVFTPMYAHVMGGTESEDYQKFVDLGCRAFSILRENTNIMMNLFLLMLAADIPELELHTIGWLRSTLVPELNEEDAKSHFLAKIVQSRKNTRAMLNDAIHIYAKK